MWSRVAYVEARQSSRHERGDVTGHLCHRTVALDGAEPGRSLHHWNGARRFAEKRIGKGARSSARIAIRILRGRALSNRRGARNGDSDGLYHVRRHRARVQVCRDLISATTATASRAPPIARLLAALYEPLLTCSDQPARAAFPAAPCQLDGACVDRGDSR